MNNHRYKFSVIIPIYNAEAYLKETIESVINQTIGFKENIQLILVNDGSEDDSEKICQLFQNQYPKNIVYINQKNKGVSGARNAGINYVLGEYVNFFDSDDVWGRDSFEKAWNFFKEHKGETDVVTCKSIFFEAKAGEHYLNNKFEKGDRIIRISDEPQLVLLSVTNSFISSERVREDLFDETISVGEDAKFITKVILKKECYGVLQSAEYRIRKRHSKSSITQNPNIGKYTVTMERYYKYLLDYSMQEYGELIPYIQYVVINGLKYRVTGTKESFMTDYEWKKYVETTTNLIRYIDDEVIASTLFVSSYTKLFIFKLKYGKDMSALTTVDNSNLCLQGNILDNIKRKKVQIRSIKESNNYLNIEGTFSIPFNENIELLLKANNNYVNIDIHEDLNKGKRYFNGETIYQGTRFCVRVELDKKDTQIHFILKCNGQDVKLEMSCNKALKEYKEHMKKSPYKAFNDNNTLYLKYNGKNLLYKFRSRFGYEC